MKVLHIINSLAVGGAEKLLLETIPKYNQAGIKTDVLLLNGKDYPFVETLKCYNCCEVYELGKSNLYSFGHVFKIIPYLKKYDLVHAHLFPTTYFLAFAKLFSNTKTPIIFTEHSTTNKRLKNKFFNYINRWVYKKFNKIVCISSEVKKVVLNKTNLAPHKCVVIKNGVDIQRFATAKPLSYQEIDDGLKIDDVLLIQVSSFRKQKDHETLIKSIEILPNHFKLILVGDGEKKAEIRDLVKAKKLDSRVIFLGQRNDIPELLKTCDIVVLSSVYEGVSLSAIEGMASGKPFIASAVPGLTGMIENHGVLFPFKNHVELAKEIKRLIEDSNYYTEIVQRCQQRANEFDISHMVASHITLYKELLKQN